MYWNFCIRIVREKKEIVFLTPKRVATPWMTCSADGSVLKACSEVYDESHFLAMVPMGIIGTIFTFSPYLLIFGLIVLIIGVAVIVLILKMKKGGDSERKPKITKQIDSSNELQHVDLEAPPSPKKRNTQKSLPVAPIMPMISPFLIVIDIFDKENSFLSGYEKDKFFKLISFLNFKGIL